MKEIGRLRPFELGYVGTPLRRKLVAAVLKGEKTATASLLVDYESATAEPLPLVGGQEVMVGDADEPVAIIETTEVRIVAAREVDLAFVHAEGEGFETLADWRAAHERFWSGQLITDETAVVCQQFRVVRRLQD